MSKETNNTNLPEFDKKKLLDELAVDIANKFGIEKEQAKELIKTETLIGIDSLKAELKRDNEDYKELNEKDVEKLFFTLKGALDVIENLSKIEIKVLKDDIEKSINIEEFKNHLEDYLPPKLIDTAKNPKVPHEHILGFALGTANSFVATVDILYKIGKGILLTPYHLYMIVTGKGKSESFKDM
ncbi:MAG: hypothetical protein QM490_01360 [Candidatus Gracilibacteria bacterium]